MNTEMKNLKELFSEMSDFNVLIRKINECPMEKTPNGYFLVSDTWGSCFLRLRKKSNVGTIKVFQREKMRCSFTAFPFTFSDNLYHVFINTNRSVKITLSQGAFIVGGHQPTRQEGFRFRNHSFLIYSPMSAPVVGLSGDDNPETVVVEKGESAFLFDFSKICDIGYVKYLNFNEDGFIAKRA